MSGRRVTTKGEQRRPRAGEAAAEGAGVDGRLLDRREAGDERCAPRLGNGVLERTRQQREVGAVQGVDERAEVRPLANRVAERHRRAEERAGAGGLDLEIRVHDDRGQARRYGQAHDVGWIWHAHEDESAVDRGRDVVAVRRSGADALAFECAGHQRLERRVRAEQTIDRHDGRDRAGGAAAETARQRQAFADGDRHTATLAEDREQRLGGDTGRVLRRIAREAALIAGDLVDAHGPRREARGHLVARRIEREAEDVEPARDIRHRRGRKRCDRFHSRVHLSLSHRENA